MFHRYLIPSLLFACIALPASAQGQRGRSQGDIDEDDVELTAREALPQRNEVVKEVARGTYVQTDPVVFDYLGVLVAVPGYNPFGAGLATGHGMRIQFGADLISKRRFGLSAQVTFWQVVNKRRAAAEPPYLHQGPTLSLLQEISVRPTLILGGAGRINLYARAGGGVSVLPQTRESAEDPPISGIYSSLAYGIQPWPFLSGGIGLEYYTRLSHFSVTFVEVDALYIMNLDVALAVNFAGLKYTF